MDATNLVAYLPFDSSTTEDLFGNTWTATGTPTIENGAIHLPSGAYLRAENIIDLNATKWTFHCQCYRVSSSGDEGFFGFGEGASKRGIIAGHDGVYIASSGGGSWQTKNSSLLFPSVTGQWKHLAIVKDGTSLKFFEGGSLVWDATIAGLNDTGVFLIGGNSYGYTNDLYFDEVCFYEGAALWSENFTPPTAKDYGDLKLEMLGSLPLELSFDVAREVINANWRYENPGTADLLSISGTTLTDLPETKSITGTAFYQTARAKCFDLPAMPEVWMKFDLYHYSGTSRFRIYDDKNGSTANGFVLTQNSSTQVALWSWDGSANYERKTFDGVLKANTLQTWLLHMTAGTTDGLLELWCDGNFVGSWSGNVNNGTDFANIYFQTDNANNIFSNVIISNAEIGLDENVKFTKEIEVTFDVKRRIRNREQEWKYYNAGITYGALIENWEPEFEDWMYGGIYGTAYAVGDPYDPIEETKTITGTAFTQCTRRKIFDVPTSHEVWMKFDVYFDGTNRWRAYEENPDDITGITAQTNGDLSFFSGGSNVYQASNVCKANQLQTVLLHMKAGRSDGVIEAWVDYAKIYTYTGDVNYDADFDNLDLQCDGWETVFSNIMISNVDISLEEGWHNLYFDVERELPNFSIEATFDVARIVTYDGIFPLELKADVVRKLSSSVLAQALKVWLPFDNSTTEDLCGNAWTADGVTIQDGELLFDGQTGAGLQMTQPFEFSKQPFTVGCWFSREATPKPSGYAQLWRLNDTLVGVYFDKDGIVYLSDKSSYANRKIQSSFSIFDGQKHYIEVGFNGISTWRLFIDGILIGSYTYYHSSREYTLTVGSVVLTGKIDDFMIYDGVILHTTNFTPPNADYYSILREGLLRLPKTFTVDVVRVVKDSSILKVWLTFDEGVTDDKCGNEWTVYGNPTIGANGAIHGNALQLDGESYLKCNSTFSVSEYQPFTIDCWFTGGDGPFFKLGDFGGGASSYYLKDSGEPIHHFALVRDFDGKTCYVFYDGTLAYTYSSTTYFTNKELFIGTYYSGSTNFTGTIDEFRVIIGDALYTENFTPAYPNGTLPWTKKVLLSNDVRREVRNINIGNWKYHNLGTADDLLVEATTITDLPKSKSVTGTAIETRDGGRTFPIPATDDLWVKFDGYLDWIWAFNAYINTSGTSDTYPEGHYGFQVIPQKNLPTQIEVVQGANIPLLVKIWGDFHTYILHMKSGVTDGIIEVWFDGTTGQYGKYTGKLTGNVNDGRQFDDFNLYSTGDGFISNIVIANTPLGFEEGYHEFTYDVIRKLVPPITIPPIGEHFNHFISSFKIYSGRLQRIVLPWSSEVYFRGISAGIVKVTSDTNPAGISAGSDFFKAGELYTQLGACQILSLTIDTNSYTPQQVIKAFMKSLDETTLSGKAAVDEAINFATGGEIETSAALAEKFFSDLEASASYTDFLETYCDIILGNNDTGAISGWDAGGDTVKNAESIVPEPVAVENWIVPTRGAVKDICGLTVHFPKRGASGSLSVAENHILAGLNSVWIEQSLKLIEESYRLDFNETGTSVRDLYVKFENSTRNSLAHVEPSYTDGKATGLELFVNMRYYNDVDMTSEHGLLKTSSPLYYGAGYLDRTLAHELTHAVMAANIDNFSELPLFIQEGTAELVHGIDDLRETDITALLTTRKSTLRNIFSSGGSSGSSDIYAAGYVFLRYLAKQGRNAQNPFAPFELELTDVLISDGATDSSYEALTNNTRQIFDADILLALTKSISGQLDIERIIFSSQSFLVDVQRKLIAQIVVQPRHNENSSQTDPSLPPPTPADLPVETKGIQSFEVTLAEQQISDQVRFVGVIPFDIMQAVSGQYLDYKYKMVIERVQQQGILYSCDCCSDIDKLLYTQISYKLPASTTWHKVDGEQIGGNQNTVEIKTIYPSAYTHANSIAHALGLSAVIQFDAFLSTVLMDEKGGVTYNDLIRDVFGWSSRIPTMMINVFIRDGKLYFVQRGKETNSIDITNAKHTEPVITRELVRTTWGSSVESKTNINEWDANVMTSTPDTIVGGGGDDDEKVFTVQDKAYGNNWSATTTYEYSTGNELLAAGGRMQAGLLVKVEINKYYDYNSEESDSYTQILHDYDSDGTRIGTETYVHYSGGENQPLDTRNINRLGYITLPGGEKYLARESTERYEGYYPGGSPTKLIDSTITTHSPSRLGQTHVTTITDDGIAGGVTGQNSGDDRVSPYRTKKGAELVTAFNNSSITTQHHEFGTTFYGLSLFDSSFPIHDEATLIKVTNALKNLNRKTKETVNVTVYDVEHLIDFNDKVTFNGNVYHLSSNTARTTPRILFEQNLTLVRWY